MHNCIEWNSFVYTMSKKISGMKKGMNIMRKNAWMLLLILICVAFLVSCGKKNTQDTEKGELVRVEAFGGM